MNSNYKVKLDGNEVMSRAKQQVWQRALMRWETGAIIAVTIILVGLCALGIFPFPATWWIWLLLGIAALAFVAYRTFKDQRFIQDITVDLFYEQFNTRRLRTIELRKLVYEAQQYHRMVYRDVQNMNTPLGMIVVDMDEWVTSVYNVAVRLDEFIKEPKILEQLRRLMELRSAKTAVLDTMEDYTSSLATLEDTEPLMDDFQLEMFREIKKGVTGANAQLGDTMNSVKQIHDRILSLRANNADVEFVRLARNQMALQLEQLDKAYRSVDRLFHLVGTTAETYAP